MSLFEITDAREEHIAEILAIERECFSVPWTEKMLKGQLSGNHFFLAELKDGAPVGYVGLMYVLDEGYISNVAVSPMYRRRGLADALLGELCRRGAEKGLAFMTLEVRESNAAARRLYEKHGFRVVGERKNYYDRPRENAILMTRYL